MAEHVSVVSGHQRSEKYTTLKPTQEILSVTEMLTTAEEVQLSAVTQISRGCPQRGTD